MAFFTKLGKRDNAKQILQKQFEEKLLEVKKLMAEKNIEASGKALLEAEQLRKAIEEFDSMK